MTVICRMGTLARLCLQITLAFTPKPDGQECPSYGVVFGQVLRRCRSVGWVVLVLALLSARQNGRRDFVVRDRRKIVVAWAMPVVSVMLLSPRANV